MPVGSGQRCYGEGGAMTEITNAPYPGTRPYDKKDSALFFGRAPETAAVCEMWRANRLTVLDGETAVGKTSLVQAGVIPLAETSRDQVLSPGQVSHDASFPEGLLPEFNPYTFALLRSWWPGETATNLAGMTICDFVRRRTERHSGSILAVIDQGEELLIDSGPRRTHQRRFLTDLAEALERYRQFHLMVVVRPNALCVVHDALGPGAQQHLEPLTRDGAIEAITTPAALCNRAVEADAAEEIVGSLQSSRLVSRSGAEHSVMSDRVQPVLLQIVCRRLWEQLPDEPRQVTRRDVRRLSDTDLALSSYCGQVLAAVAEQQDLPTARLRAWVRQAFITEVGTRGNAYEGITETAGMPNAVARSLEDSRMLSSEQRAGSRWYQLLSDRLISPLRERPDREPEPIPLDGAELLRAAERSLTAGEFDLAANYAARSQRIMAADTDLRLQAWFASFLGNLAYEQGKPADAETEYRRAAELFGALPDTMMVAYELGAAGRMLLAQGQQTAAVNQLRAAVERAPNDPVLQTELARALWQLGQSRAAVAVLTSVLGLDAGNREALRTRGEVLAYLGQPDQAMLDLERVDVSGQPSTRAARGLARAELGDYSAADEDINGALDEAPRNGAVLLFAAKATAVEGDRRSARELARRAVEASDPALSPRHRDSAFELLKLNGNGHR
jgi:tetratricopeptide (TPR) repeat protein